MKIQKPIQPNVTRTLSPKLGILGLLGLVGFVGIWTYQADKTVYPFLFFGFFGFFGFFFEGKMSCTLKDERYNQNKLRAWSKAYRLGYMATFIALIISTIDFPFKTNDTKLLFLTVTLSLIFAIVTFLSEYLLYRFDHTDSEE